MTENSPPFDKKYSNIYQHNVWVGYFYKVSACGKKSVNIKTEKNKPCNSEFTDCTSFDKGACVEIVQSYKISRFVVLK
jgi:hypothetical protein